MAIRPRNPSDSAVAPPGVQFVTIPAVSPEAAAIVARARVRHPALPSEDGSLLPVVRSADSPSVLPKRAHHKVDRTSANWDEDGDYIVGKSRPPKAHQWQKGQSGNPRGPKPAEKLDPQTAFENAVLSSFPAKVNGTDVSMSLGEFGLNLMKAAAAKGNRQAAAYLVELYLQTLRKTADIEVGVELLAGEQAAVDAILNDLDLDATPVRRKTDRSVGNDGEAQ